MITVDLDLGQMKRSCPDDGGMAEGDRRSRSRRCSLQAPLGRKARLADVSVEADHPADDAWGVKGRWQAYWRSWMVGTRLGAVGGLRTKRLAAAVAGECRCDLLNSEYYI